MISDLASIQDGISSGDTRHEYWLGQLQGIAGYLMVTLKDMA